MVSGRTTYEGDSYVHMYMASESTTASMAMAVADVHSVLWLLIKGPVVR